MTTGYRRKVAIIERAVYCALAVILFLYLFVAVSAPASAADACAQFQSTMAREAQSVYGPDAPTPMFMGQMRQESTCRPGITAADLGRGLAQFMDGTTKQVTALFPELGPADPYNPRWAMRAMARYDGWIYRRVKGKDDCHRWAAVLKGFNAGPGYVQQAQAKSSDPGTWFGVTEFVQTRQSPSNFEYSRTYPHKILFKHQLLYVSTGKTTCLPRPS